MQTTDQFHFGLQHKTTQAQNIQAGSSAQVNP